MRRSFSYSSHPNAEVNDMFDWPGQPKVTGSGAHYCANTLKFLIAWRGALVISVHRVLNSLLPT